MDIRKIASAAALATGAAVALAPFAQADPVEITSTVSSEIASLNSLFEFGATLTGVPAADITLSAAGFDVVPLADAPNSGTATAFDYFLYGVDPINQASSDPGSYDLFNGALGKFDDAYNVLLYGSLNNGVIDPNDADFIGSASSIDHAQGLASVTDAFDYLYNFGVNDLSSYFGSDLSFLLIPTTDAVPGAADAAAVDLSSTFTSEITGLNSLFGLDASAAGVSADVIPGSGAFPFDTIAPGDTNDIFNTLVFGLNPDNISTDPGSYDVFNGALTEFANAYNVGLFSLLDPTSTFDPGDIFGTHADFLAGGATSAISEFLQLGVSDLAGYFDFGSLAGM